MGIGFNKELEGIDTKDPIDLGDTVTETSNDAEEKVVNDLTSKSKDKKEKVVKKKPPIKKKSNNTTVIAVVVIILVLVSIGVYKTFLNKKGTKVVKTGANNSTAVNSTQVANSTTAEDGSTEANPNAVYDEAGNLISSNGVYDEEGNVIKKDAITPGVKDYSDDGGDDGTTTTAKVYASTDFVKDLNGLSVPAAYNVKTRSYVHDVVNYTAKRAIVSDGMEMYWLDVTYHNKKYRMQVPYMVFKSLEETGIIGVNVEILNLAGGEKIISYMEPLYDYSERINGDTE